MNLMAQEDVIEVHKTLTPVLSVVRQYLGEVLHNHNLTSADTSSQLLVDDKPVVSDDLIKGDTSDAPVVTLGECIFQGILFQFVVI